MGIVESIFSVTDKITELAKGMSSKENDDLPYLPPLRVLNVLAEHLTSNTPAKSAPVLLNKTSQTDQADHSEDLVKFESAQAGGSSRQSDTPTNDNNFQDFMETDEPQASPEQMEQSVSLSVDPGVDEKRVVAVGKICPLCKEEMSIKNCKAYHFASTHFQLRLEKELPSTKKPFLCPYCGEEFLTKMNLWVHYIGRAHKHLEEWLEEYQKAEVKPDWCDPTASNPKSHRRGGGGPSSNLFSSPSSPLVTSSTQDRSSPVGKEWFCDLCHGMVPQRREIHFASLHFKEKLKALLPTQAPFICPDIMCRAEHKHFLNLPTHFLTQHGHLKLWLEERGINYEPGKRNRLEKQVSLPEPMDTKEDLLPLSSSLNKLGKRQLSSSESESEGLKSVDEAGCDIYEEEDQI